MSEETREERWARHGLIDCWKRPAAEKLIPLPGEVWKPLRPPGPVEGHYIPVPAPAAGEKGQAMKEEWIEIPDEPLTHESLWALIRSGKRVDKPPGARDWPKKPPAPAVLTPVTEKKDKP